MTDIAVVDCATGETTVRAMTVAEVAAHAAIIDTPAPLDEVAALAATVAQLAQAQAGNLGIQGRLGQRIENGIAWDIQLCIAATHSCLAVFEIARQSALARVQIKRRNLVARNR